MASLIGRLFVFILFFLLLLSPGFSQSIPPLDEILKRAGDNLQAHQDNLPDFECRETVMQRVSEKGKVKEEKIESIFRGFQKPQRWKGMTAASTELREYKSVNGKQISKNDKRQRKELVGFHGGFSALLISTFSSENQKFHNYQIAGIETIQGRQALALTFATIEGQNKFFWINMGKPLAGKDIGKAWLDLDSMQVIRLERRMLNVPAKYNPALFAVDYTKVDIAEKEFWMPKSVKYEISEKKGSLIIDFSAEYADYRKFDVSNEIKYGPEIPQ
jgi:hypothetical protein